MMKGHPMLQLIPEDPTERQHHKCLDLTPGGAPVRVGRVTNFKSASVPNNCFFDSKVLSRQHAEIWATDDGRVMICDVGSSNGTFVNNERLSPEGARSEPRELFSHDSVVFGVNIYNEEDNSVIYKRVAVRANVLPMDADPSMRQRFNLLMEDRSATLQQNVKVPSPQRSMRHNATSADSSLTGASMSAAASASAVMPPSAADASGVRRQAKSIEDQIQQQTMRHKNFSMQLMRLQCDAEPVINGDASQEQINRVSASLMKLDEECQVAIRSAGTLRSNLLASPHCANDQTLQKLVESITSEARTMEQSLGLLAQKLRSSKRLGPGAASAVRRTAPGSSSSQTQHQHKRRMRSTSGSSQYGSNDGEHASTGDVTWTTTLIFCTLVSVALALIMYRVSTHEEAREAFVQFFIQTFKYDPTPLLERVAAGTEHLSDRAAAIYERIHKAFLPRAVGL